MNTLLACAALIFALPAAASPVYELVGEPPQQRLVAKTTVTSAPLNDALALIEAQKDFDGDGVLDALYLTNCGGNGCAQSEYAFATVRDGKLVLAPIGSAANARVIRKGNTWLVELESESGWQTYAFVGGKAVPYATKARTVLHAMVEVKGVAPYEKAAARSFQADVDLDGTPETITCTIWERWGSLLCTLPLGKGGQTLSTGCDRFGALATTSNGRREFVCNADQVVRFDGTRWVEPKPTP